MRAISYGSRIEMNQIQGWRFDRNNDIDVLVNNIWYMYSSGSCLNKEYEELVTNGIPHLEDEKIETTEDEVF